MAERIPWYGNAKMRVEGTTLHIEVELDRDKIEPAPDNGFLASVEANLHDEKPPMRVNVWVRPLRPANKRG